MKCLVTCRPFISAGEDSRFYLTRIIEGDEENLRVTFSSLFSFDYIGGLIGSITFPLLPVNC